MRSNCGKKLRLEMGFSLVELLVALVFTAILMAGMATVFRSSLASFVSSSEGLSNQRRNRMALDVIYDDLNQAGLEISNLKLFNAPNWRSPGLSITPSTSPASLDPTLSADRLQFTFDDIAPIDATNRTTVLPITQGGAVDATNKLTFVLECRDDELAKLIQPGMNIFFKQNSFCCPIVTATRNGKFVTCECNAPVHSRSIATQSENETPHLAEVIRPDRSVLVLNPGRMAQYAIENRKLDPASNSDVPCLIRQLATGGVVTATELIAENVQDLKVFISADGGLNWRKTPADLAQDITDVRLKGLTTDPFWYRHIPVQVRLDIITRTAMQREQYSQTPGTVAHKTFTQSVVMLPRQFGLPIATNSR